MVVMSEGLIDDIIELIRYVNKKKQLCQTCLVALAAMTSPRAESDLLMFWASFRAVPVAPAGRGEGRLSGGRG